MAQIEVTDHRVRVIFQLAPVRGIRRKPSPRRDIKLRPVMHVVVVRLGPPPRLPPRRNPADATHRDEQHRLHPAVAPTAQKRLLAQARNNAVLFLRALRDRPRDKAKDFPRRRERIDITPHDLRRGFPRPRREPNVRLPLQKLRPRKISRQWRTIYGSFSNARNPACSKW
jgi:hypothetical protein